jgi:5S rRNA maturation endonuclease (ribonuclease M5)
MQDISYDEAKEWLHTGGELSASFERAVKPKEETFEDLVYISNASLDAFTEPTSVVLRSRGLTPAAARLHDIRWDALRENWVIPIRDGLTSDLMGWQEKSFVGRYFSNHPQGMQKSKTLFGFDRYAGGDLILMESPLDVVRLESLGISGGVASFGTSVSDEQIKLLTKVNKGRIIVAMDNDDAGRYATEQVMKRLLELKHEAWFFNYKGIDVKDIGGMYRQEVYTGLEHAVHSVRYGMVDSILTNI